MYRRPSPLSIKLAAEIEARQTLRAFERDFAKFIMAGDAALGFVPLPDPHPVPELNGPVHHKEPFPAQALKRWGAR